MTGTRKSLPAIWLTMLVVFAPIAGVTSIPAAAATNSCNPCTMGGDTTDGALNITITDGFTDVERYDGSSFNDVYYSDHYDTVLYIDGTSYGIVDGHADQSLSVSAQYKTNGGETIVTEFDVPGETVTFVQKVDYSGAQGYFDLTFEVTNNGGGSLSDVRVLRGATATDLRGTSTDKGFYTSDTDTVGIRKTVDGTEYRYAIQGVTDSYEHESDAYGTNWNNLGDGSLSGNVDTTEHDGGYAMEWRQSSIASSNTWTVDARETFTQSSILVTGPGGTQTVTGDSIDLAFDVENFDSSSTSVSFSTDGPSGWTISTPSDTSIGSGNTDQVTVTANPPNDAISGTYDVTLTGTPSGGAPDSATTQVEIPNSAPSAPDNSDESTDEDSSVSVADGDTQDLLELASDPDGDSLSLTQIDGSSFSAGSTVDLASGGQVTVNSDGSWTYDPNGAYENLNAGDTATDKFTYTVSDGNGGTDQGTITVTVTGVDDGPTFLSDSTASFDEGSTGTVVDVDANAGSGADSGVTYSLVGGSDSRKICNVGA